MERIDIRRAAVCFLLLSTLAACGAGPSPEPVEEEPADSPPRWLVGLPRQPVEADAGAVVWAVVPCSGSDAARLAVYRLEAVEGTSATLRDGIGNRYEGVPGTLIHPMAASDAALRSGATVLVDRWGESGAVSRVTSVDGGAVVVAYDHNGETVERLVELARPLPVEGEGWALRSVVYPVGEARYKGLVIASSSNRLWVLDDGGGVAVVAMGSVQRLDDLGRSFAEGEAVEAYSWGGGYRGGVVEAVVEPDLRYEVRLEDGLTRRFSFDQLHPTA